MSLLGRKWPTPIGAIIYYGVWKIEDKMLKSEEWRDHPRNPYRSTEQAPGASQQAKH
ncbi:MAG: hypothetical protein M1815_002294 [Lichina confinis]|nr:MAG: hypothetical protein M1815_002294 [Lichina confinis]